MKKKRKWVLPVVLGAIFLLIVAVVVFAMNMPPMPTVVDTIVMERADLVNKVSVNGTVVSVNSQKVYATVSYPIEEITVEVGDTVNVGDLLCRMDSSSLESSIAQQTATLSKSQAIAAQNLADAQRELDTARQNLQKELDTSLISAKTQLDSAEASMLQAALDVTNSRRDLRNARDGKSYDILDGEVHYSFDYDNDDMLYDLDTASQKSQIAYKGSQIAYENAKANLEAAEEAAQQRITTFEASVQSTRITGDYSNEVLGIQKLRDDVAKCTVTAPVSGTVTAIYAEEGASPTGLLFVIEDTNRLKVDTKIKEYDMGSISIGDKVEIRTDATGDATYEGNLSKIAPTSVKNVAGEIADTTNVEFEAEVRVAQAEESLRIGMKARLNIITAEAKNVFSVPFDALAENEAGQEIVYIVRRNEDGTSIAEPVVVQTGLETDFSIEISAPEITPGVEVVFSAQKVSPGASIMTAEELAAMVGQGTQSSTTTAAVSASPSGEDASTNTEEEASRATALPNPVDSVYASQGESLEYDTSSADEDAPASSSVEISEYSGSNASSK